MRIAFDFEVEIRGEATSSYDEGTIRRRLEVIDPDSEEAAYLGRLLEKLTGG